MNNLDKVIEDYLSKQTNYAFLITGKWGVGKTYYYKHRLVEKISSVVSFSNASKKYNSVHISLFGLASIEEIQTQIFLSLHPFLKNKAVKLSAGLGKAIARGILAIKNLGDIDDYITDVKPDKGEWIDLSQLVICFDDLERISDKLSLEELIGFINSLVENDDAKIILIANEDKIDSTNYKDLKEKVIGVSVEFIPDSRKNIEKIIADRYSCSFRLYSEFLTEHIELLLDVSRALENNLRILIFSLDFLHRIYSEIKTNIIDIASKKDAIVIKKLENVVRFTLGVSIEYKKLNISYGNRQDIDKSGTINLKDLDFSRISFASKDEPIEIEKSYRESFIESYYKSQSDYKFYESIFSYITGANQFDLHSLLREVDEAFHVENEKVLPQYEILNQINYQNYFNNSDKEFRQLTKKMVDYAEKGSYSIRDYLTVFHYATRFDNILNYKIDRLKLKMIKGLRKAKKISAYIDSLDIYLSVPEDAVYKKELLEIRQCAVIANDELKIEQERLEALGLLDMINTDWSAFNKIVMDKNQKWSYTPLFSHTSSHKIYLAVNKFDLRELREFVDLIKYRYKDFPQSYFKTEIPFLTQLKQKLGPNSKLRRRKNLRNYLLNSICDLIETAIEKIERQ